MSRDSTDSSNDTASKWINKAQNSLSSVKLEQPGERYGRVVRAYRRLCGGLQAFSKQWSFLAFYMVGVLITSVSFTLMVGYGWTDDQIGRLPMTYAGKLSTGIAGVVAAIGVVLMAMKCISISQTHNRVSTALTYGVPWGHYSENDAQTIATMQQSRGCMNISFLGDTIAITPSYAYTASTMLIAFVTFQISMAGVNSD